MPDSASTVLIALKPIFADAILGGRKRYELRRFVPRFEVGDRLLIYASSPVQRVVGMFVVGSVCSGSPQEVWEAIGGESSGLPEGSFFGYLGGAKRCAAVGVKEPRRFHEPIKLALRPPQSYCYLKPEVTAHRALLELAQRG